MMSNKCKFSILTGFVLVGVVFNSVQARDKPYLLTDVQWNVPRTESAILSMPTLQSVMKAYQADQTTNRLLIKYPGGDEGTLWAYELRSWLVSLGISSNHIELVPGARNVNQLEIFVQSAKEQH